MIRPLYVAELTINHLGMLKISKAMIKAAKNSGADFVKLKIKNVKKYYDDSVADWRNFPFGLYRQSLELSEGDFRELDTYCNELDIPWFSTVHDLNSLEFIKSFNPPMYKVASMDIDKLELLDAVIETCRREKKPLVASVGGKDLNSIRDLVKRIIDANVNTYLLHTVSIYPTPLGRSNINFLSYLKEQFEGHDGKMKIGYSGHETGISASVLAGIRGAAMIERHFTLSRDFQVHHMDAAITPEEFQQMIGLTKEMLIEASAKVLDVDHGEKKFLEKMDYTKFKEE